MDTLIFYAQFSIWIRYVYGFFKLSTYFRHGIPVSCNHSKGTASWVLKTACHPFWNRYFIGNFFSPTVWAVNPSKICLALWDGIPRRLPDSPKTRGARHPLGNTTQFPQSTAATRPESAQEAAALIARCCPIQRAFSRNWERAFFAFGQNGGQGSDLSGFSISMDSKNRTIVLFYWHKQWYGVKLI